MVATAFASARSNKFAWSAIWIGDHVALPRRAGNPELPVAVSVCAGVHPSLYASPQSMHALSAACHFGRMAWWTGCMEFQRIVRYAYGRQRLRQSSQLVDSVRKPLPMPSNATNDRFGAACVQGYRELLPAAQSACCCSAFSMASNVASRTSMMDACLLR